MCGSKNHTQETPRNTKKLLYCCWTKQEGSLCPNGGSPSAAREPMDATEARMALTGVWRAMARCQGANCVDFSIIFFFGGGMPWGNSTGDQWGPGPSNTWRRCGSLGSGWKYLWPVLIARLIARPEGDIHRTGHSESGFIFSLQIKDTNQFSMSAETRRRGLCNAINVNYLYGLR